MGAELVRWRYSTTEGSAGNSFAQGSPDAALGLYVSTTDWSGSLFDAQPLDDLIPDHRCVFAVNLNGSLSLKDTSVYMSGNLPTMSALQIGLDPIGASVLDATSAQAVQIALETEEPLGVKFSEPINLATAIPMGVLGPLSVQAVWVRRIPGAGAQPTPSESFTLRLSGTLTP